MVSDHTPKSGGGRHKTARSKKKIVIVLVVVLAILLAIVGGAALWGKSKFDQIEKIDDPFAGIDKLEGVDKRPTHKKEDSTPINFLVLGSDSRVSAGDPSQWSAGAQRTDAIMIVQLAGDRKSVNVMSIPRDSWVDIPGHGKAKINAGFSYGGPPLAIATVEQLTEIPIDHFAIVDFNSFVSLTDAIGGVEMTTATEGTRTYNGKEALAFVRERYSLPGGDFDRVRRQQLWMKAVMSKLLTKENLTSPTKLLGIYDKVSPYVAIDEGFDMSTMLDLAPELTDLRSDGFNFMTAPVDGTGMSEDGQSIVLLNQEQFDALSKAFVDDEVATYVKEHQDTLRTLSNEPVN